MLISETTWTVSSWVLLMKLSMLSKSSSFSSWLCRPRTLLSFPNFRARLVLTLSRADSMMSIKSFASESVKSSSSEAVLLALKKKCQDLFVPDLNLTTYCFLVFSLITSTFSWSASSWGASVSWSPLQPLSEVRMSETPPKSLNIK